MSTDIKVERDYSSWKVTALTLRGRAVLEALELADGAKVDNAGHLSVLEAAQCAGAEVDS